MKIDSVELHDKKFEKEIEFFLSNTNKNFWKQKIKQLDASNGKFYGNVLKTRNPLLEPFRQYFELQSKGKSIRKHTTKGINLLVRTAFITNKILYNLNDVGKKQIIGRFRDANIRPLLHEFSILTHFLSNGFEVEPIEYERKSCVERTFDFLIKKDCIEAEVECKFKSYDAGRKITTDGFAILCDEVIKQLDSYKIKCIIEILCTKNLGKNHGTFFNIVNQLKSGIEQKISKIILDENFSINIDYLDDDLKINSYEELKKVIIPYLTERSHFALISNKDLVIIIKVQSEEPDKVLSAMHIDLKDSINQFSKTRPSLIACYIEGIYPEQWERLRKKSGLAVVADRLFDKKNSSHIHTVSFLSEMETSQEENITENWHTTLFFKNPNCQFDKETDVFALGKKSCRLG